MIANNKVGGEIIVKKVEVVLQDSKMDCGVCCLLSIIRYYGGNASKEYLKELTNTTKNGVSAYHLINASKMLGFQSIGVEGEVENLKKEDLPSIAHVIIHKSYQHFLVIYDIDFLEQKVLIMDPAKGKKVISLSEFKLISSNQYILLKPIRKLPEFTVKKIIYQYLKEEIKKEKNIVFIILTLSIFYFFLHLLTAYHFKYLLEYAITPFSISNVITISSTVGFLFLLKEVTNFFRNIVLLKWSDNFDFHLTTKVLTQIISFPYLYYKNRTTGEVLARMKDLSIVKKFITTLICVGMVETCSLLLFTILLFQLNKSLASYVVLFFGCFLLSEVLFYHPQRKKLKKYLRREDLINSHLIEVISAFDVVKGLHMEEKVMKKFIKQYRAFLSTHYELVRISYIEEYCKNNLNHIMMVIILLLGAKQVILGEFSLSEFIIFQSILLYSSTSFLNMITIFKDYREYRVSKERVEDLFTIKNENFAMKDYFFDQNLIGPIIYHNFSYAYHSYPLIRSVSLTIPYGNKVFFYGKSGSGKSTMVKSLLRYIKVPFGKLSINHIDINHYHLGVLRNHITYVSQNEYLFTNTIRKNILMGREVSDECLKDIIGKMQLEELISHSSLGLDMLLEENGFNLSGGERQRLILARSVLKQSDIYIFDEATSQIDSKTERKILENIFHLLKGKTIIVISHRLDNQDLFDQVLRMEEGKCYEEKL